MEPGSGSHDPKATHLPPPRPHLRAREQRCFVQAATTSLIRLQDRAAWAPAQKEGVGREGTGAHPKAGTEPPTESRRGTGGCPFPRRYPCTCRGHGAMGEVAGQASLYFLGRGRVLRFKSPNSR